MYARRRLTATILAFGLLAAACGEEAAEELAADEPAVDESATDEQDAANGEEAVEVREMTFAFLYEATHPHNTCGSATLEEVLAENPEAGISLDIFPGGQLGNEAEMAEAVISGDQEMGLAGPNYLAEYYEPLSGIELAFLYDDMDHVNRVMSGEIGQELLRETEEATGLKILGTWMIGNWQVYTDSPIREPADLDGQSLRMPPSSLMQANGQAMGANPTPVDFGEVYLALQQGVVDAASTTLGLANDMSWYEPVTYVNMLGAIWSDVPVIMNRDVWESLSAEQQDVIQTAVDEASDRIQQCIVEEEEEILNSWVEDGQIEVVSADEIDIDAFREQARETLIAELGDWVEDIFDRIREMS